MADPAPTQSSPLTAQGPIAQSALGYGWSRWNARDGSDREAQITVLRSSMNSDPSADVFDALSKRAEFQSEPAKTNLQNLRTKPEFQDFRNALNSAIRNDPTVAPGLLDAQNSGPGGLDIPGVVATVQDPTKRGIMTRVMDAVGKPPQAGQPDNLDFSYLTRVARQGQSGDYAGLKTSLREAGIQDKTVDMAASGGPFAQIMAGLSSFTNNPSGFLSNNFGGAMSGMSNLWKGIIDAFANGFASFIDPKGDWLGHYIKGFGEIFGGQRAGLEARGAALNIPAAAPAAAAPVTPVRTTDASVPGQERVATASLNTSAGRIQFDGDLGDTFGRAHDGKIRTDQTPNVGVQPAYAPGFNPVG